MKRTHLKRRLLLCGLLALVIGLSCWLIYRQARQQRLDRALVAAREHFKTEKAIVYLIQADGTNEQLLRLLGRLEKKSLSRGDRR